MRLIPVLLFAAFATTAAAQTSRYETILVPFDTMTLETGSGRWRSELWVRNNGIAPANVWAAECSFFGEPAVCSRRLDIPVGRTILADGFDPDGSSPGVFLYVDRAQLDDLVFSLRVRDLNRGAEDFGTELPVIRGSNLIRDVAHLINVPLSLNGRVQLRIYSSTPRAAFRVRVYTEPDGNLIGEQTVAIAVPNEGLEPAELPQMVDASAVFRGWVADRVRVSVERLEPAEGSFWPLLTITNSRNNHVTVVSPR